MKNSEYWKKRFELLEQSQNQQGLQCYADIEKQYRQAQKQIEGQIAAWYQRFAKNNGITLADARKMLTSKELEELKWDINQYIQYGEENAINGTWVKQLENASARYHISRLEALKLQTQQSIEAMFGNQLDSIDSAMRNIYTSGYYRTAFEIQKGVGVGWDFATLDEKQISKIINKPWAVDGKNFSERIWGNRQKLVNELNTELTRNVILGQDPQKAIDAIARKMNTSKNVAGRLVMTEEAFFSSAAQKDCFAELDVEQFEIVATLDSHTSDICREMDGKHFPMSQWEVGVTAPPFHVWCRSTTVPFFDDEFDSVGERAARGEDGKTYYVPANMTYKQWQQSFVEGDKTGLQKVSKFANADNIDDVATEMLGGHWEEYRQKFLGNATKFDVESNKKLHLVTTLLGKYKDIGKVEKIFEQIDDLSSSFYSPLQSVKWMDKNEAIFGKAFATSNHGWGYGTAEIRFNPIKLTDEGIDRIAELSKTGYSITIPKGKEIEYLVSHEFGHCILNIGEKLPSTAKNFVQCDLQTVKKARSEITAIFDDFNSSYTVKEKAYKEFSKKLDSKFLFDMTPPTDAERIQLEKLKSEFDEISISRYAMTSPDEFVAECFADVTLNGDKAKETSKKVYEVIKKYFGK